MTDPSETARQLEEEFKDAPVLTLEDEKGELVLKNPVPQPSESTP